MNFKWKDPLWNTDQHIHNHQYTNTNFVLIRNFFFFRLKFP